MANCLVTGHKGYIGSKLYDKLQRLGHNVRGIDIKSEDITEKLDIRWHLFDYEKNFNHLKFKPEYIFHLAAKPSVQWSVENPSDSLTHNVMGSSRVLEYAKLVGAKRVIFASSAAAIEPTSPYGAHKRMTELECKIYSVFKIF
jgi:UDP-glucose 4-epimerase